MTIVTISLPTRRHEIESLSDAYEVLQQRNVSAGKILSYDGDSILFLTPQAKPRTAWIHRSIDGEIEKIKVAIGFSIDEPPLGWWER